MQEQFVIIRLLYYREQYNKGPPRGKNCEETKVTGEKYSFVESVLASCNMKQL